MATIDFNEIFQELKSAATAFAKQQFSDYLQAAESDANNFVDQAKVQLERWATELASGKLTTDDFAWLIKGQKDLAEMTLLQQAGVALIRVDQFKAGLLDVIVKTITAKIV